MRRCLLFLILVASVLLFGLDWDVYFSQSVDHRFATTRLANGNTTLKNIVIDIINSAGRSVDVCVYEVNSMDIARALINARRRGVSVRVIIDRGYRDYPAIDSIIASGIKVIDQGFGRNSGGIMHNKFMLVDFGDSLNESLVVGSFNFTDIPNADNIIVIRNAHDILYNYYREFNQMWGSTTTTPDSLSSFFGAYKSEITPHIFSIGGRRVEQYFLPKDSLASVLKQAIKTAQYEIYFSIYLFTMSDVCDAMRNQKDSLGVVVRGVFDSRSWNAPYSVAPSMTTWAYVYRDSAYYSLHHKYLLIDPSYPGSDPIVITGSPNWTSSADNINDENFLVIHDPELANIYLQEFAARFTESGGSIEPVTPSLDHIIISEVFYDTPGSDAVEEWLELYNPTLFTVNISGYTINNRNGFGTHYRIPNGNFILPRSFFVVAKDSSGFAGLGYGVSADLYANFGTLSNTGDCIILKDSLGQVVDYVAWEGGGAYGIPSGWGSNTLPFANTGKSIARNSLFVDTDTYVDWVSNAIPSPKNFIPVAVDEEYHTRDDIYIYPLPARERLNILVGSPIPSNIELFNIMGQRVYSAEKIGDHKEISVDLSGYPAGVYFLVVRLDGKVRFFKTIPVVR